MIDDFWTSFFAGLASGIVLVVIGAIIRRVLRKRAKGESFKLATKGLRPFVAVVIGFALIFIDVFLVKDGGVLRGLGAMILIWSALDFLESS